MNEAEWLECTDPNPMLGFLRGKASDRKLRLFACACCRMLWHRLEQPSQMAVEVAERFADGNATPKDMEQAARPLLQIRPATCRTGAALYSTKGPWHPAFPGLHEAVRISVYFAAKARGGGKGQRGNRVLFLRCMFGNPFRPSPPLPPAVLTWNDRIIPRIAEGIYQERKMPEGTLDRGRLGILHDALLDAGCDNEELLTHLRSEGPHYRGCWPVDLILGKE